MFTLSKIFFVSASTEIVPKPPLFRLI